VTALSLESHQIENETNLSSRQQLRQLGDAGCNLSRLILGHEIRRNTSARLRLEIDIRHGKLVDVADDVGDVLIFLDCPRCREAAACHEAAF